MSISRTQRIIYHVHVNAALETVSFFSSAAITIISFQVHLLRQDLFVFVSHNEPACRQHFDHDKVKYSTSEPAVKLNVLLWLSLRLKKISFFLLFLLRQQEQAFSSFASSPATHSFSPCKPVQ